MFTKFTGYLRVITIIVVIVMLALIAALILGLKVDYSEKCYLQIDYNNTKKCVVQPDHVDRVLDIYNLIG